ncbi:MAG TPA: undecaprenyl-phosphate glucose phosphotransferase [Candidatus Eisenbacteria bacterium]|nr:undecaprenyl-phosphate glucose phosphotransferase [Candidatus Eisenbacteria bacterium]
MLTRHRQLLATAVFGLDATLVAFAWLLAYQLRFWLWPAPLGVPPLSLYMWMGAVVMLVTLLVLRAFPLYRSARTARLIQELATLAQGMLIVTALAALASFFARGELSRSVLLLFLLLAVGMLWASRIVIRLTLRALRRSGRNLRHALVVGTGELARELLRRIGWHPEYGIAVAGLVAGDASEVGREVAGVRVIGAVDELDRLVEQTGAEIVYLALARADWDTERAALDRLANSTAAVRLVPDLARAFVLNTSVEDLDGMPVVLVTETPGAGWNAVLKRAFDLVFAALALIVLAPVMALVALWVRVDSPGPVLYAQERVGMNGRRFRMLKFRTMRADAERDGEGWTTAGDPRRTRAGAVLRRLSLDELPQFWNVLLGHMSLVGPRPERPVYVDRFRATIPRYMLRHHVKAGITGWAQVHGLRGDTSLDQRVEYDLYYIRNWSPALDLKILALTLVRVFRDANAH